MSRERVVITGLGVFCGAARDIPGFRRAVIDGTSGVGPVDLFDVSAFPSHIAVQVKGFDPVAHFGRRTAAKLSRADQFGLIAAGEALGDSGIAGGYDSFAMGVVVGAGAAGMFQSEQWLAAALQERQISPSLLRGILPDKTSTVIAETFGLAGYQGTITTACSSSATAIGWGADLVATGKLDAVVCGGSDTLSMLTFAGFNSLKVVDPEPCAPFSLGRQGITLGEGAAFLVLERESVAAQRGAKVYGAVLGYAMAGEAHHMTAPDPTGQVAARLMHDAMANAGIAKGDVGWVNAHGTGTPLNDVVESNAMKRVFGERAGSVPLISTKPITGHCLGAAGAIEAVATMLALGERTIPKTLHFRGRDPECDLDYCHDSARPATATVAMSNSFAFGGNITSLVLGL
ncbi:beta-ketoacyl-[acyl-carrier-protein] synthase family protein [Geobacter pelophilus]|uniref:Beta-ketoacyl-[acyl-carrier-protein] synthase family protein n=1 Tax=Geoanaerobacter pelophilus TaxID=60036 RepID=A0AAW4L1D4_9BACT|nr:beta-ketoacyl-[acyl-carrier-protein] synthase family protein [Geoanaerobacter pelophilus]MBT0663342.1 beta-ketoacyl-[acyl-carrier-protein] synthase family protein [Geoanaerobacter pelophilus]